jgi:hypothetical protein
MGEAGDDHRMGTLYTYQFKNSGTTTGVSTSMQIKLYSNSSWSSWSGEIVYNSTVYLSSSYPVTQIKVYTYINSKYYTITNNNLSFTSNNRRYELQCNTSTNYVYMYEYNTTNSTSGSYQGYYLSSSVSTTA